MADVKALPEDNIPSFVGLPSPYERNIGSNGGFHDIPPAVKLPSLFRVSRNCDTFVHSAGVVADRNASRLHSGVRTGGGEDAWFAGRMGVQTGDEGALGNELDADLAVEIPRLQEFVPAREEEARSGGENLERARENHVPAKV